MVNRNSTGQLANMVKAKTKNRPLENDNIPSNGFVYNTLHYHVVPALKLAFFTFAVQFLAHKANPASPFHFDK